MNPFYFTPAFAMMIILGMAVLLGMLVYYSRKQSRIRRSFEELARRVHGTVSRKSLVVGDILEGQHGGVPFVCRHMMGSKNNPPSLTIRAYISCPVQLTIRRKAWYDRFARQIGLLAELQTGDPVFDQAYFLDTDQTDFFQFYFTGEEKRREVEAIFGLGFPVRKIVFGKKDIRIVLSPFQGDAIAAVPLERYLDALLKLSGGLSSAGYSAASFGQYLFPGGSRSPVSRFVLALLFVQNGILILGGAAALACGMEQYKPLGNRLIVNALFLSALSALVFLVSVFRWIRGRSSSHRLFLFILISSLIGFPLAMTGGAVATNGFLDRGIEASRQVSVTDHYFERNKNNRTYYLAFSSWQRPGQTDRISVSCDFFREVHPGEIIIIRTKPGYWQEEWIAGIQKPPDVSRRPDGSAGFPLTLRSIRFYEDGPSKMPGENRRYAMEFARETSRYIYCEVNMENNLWRQRDHLYAFVWQYINSDGSTYRKLSMPFTVRKTWKTAWVCNSWGWDQPGHWPPGNYRVVVLVDGHPFGEGVFTVR
jgi:uncharacterized membrane protein YidH (DUF202 family)